MEAILVGTEYRSFYKNYEKIGLVNHKCKLHLIQKELNIISWKSWNDSMSLFKKIWITIVSGEAIYVIIEEELWKARFFWCENIEEKGEKRREKNIKEKFLRYVKREISKWSGWKLWKK